MVYGTSSVLDIGFASKYSQGVGLVSRHGVQDSQLAWGMEFGSMVLLKSQ